MKRFAIGCVLIFAIAKVAAADQTNTFATLVTQRGTFTNASIRGVSGGYAIVIYDGGGQRIPLSELPDAIQKRYATNSAVPSAAPAARRQRMMSPAQYRQWEMDHAPELMLRQVTSQIGVVQTQIAAFQRSAGELQGIGGSPQMPTQRSTITPMTAEMFFSQGTTNGGRSTLDAYNDRLQELLKLKAQLQQIVAARQRAQPSRAN